MYVYSWFIVLTESLLTVRLAVSEIKPVQSLTDRQTDRNVNYSNSRCACARGLNMELTQAWPSRCACLHAANVCISRSVKLISSTLAVHLFTKSKASEKDGDTTRLLGRCFRLFKTAPQQSAQPATTAFHRQPLLRPQPAATASTASLYCAHSQPLLRPQPASTASTASLYCAHSQPLLRPQPHQWKTLSTWLCGLRTMTLLSGTGRRQMCQGGRWCGWDGEGQMG